MSPKLLLQLVLLAAQASATGNDLNDLDRVGRHIAEQPCAKPRVANKVEKNIHDESVRDRFISQKCPAAESEIVRSSLSQYKQVIPLSASISRTDQRVPIAFQVGSPLSSIRNRLGNPEVEKPDSITYLLPSEIREERVTFRHDGSRVSQIQWSWYFD